MLVEHAGNPLFDRPINARLERGMSRLVHGRPCSSRHTSILPSRANATRREAGSYKRLHQPACSTPDATSTSVTLFLRCSASGTCRAQSTLGCARKPCANWLHSQLLFADVFQHNDRTSVNIPPRSWRCQSSSGREFTTDHSHKKE